MFILSLRDLWQNQSLKKIQFHIPVLCFPHHSIVGIHLCENQMCQTVCHMPLSISLLHEKVSSQTVEYEVHQYETDTDT